MSEEKKAVESRGFVDVGALLYPAQCKLAALEDVFYQSDNAPDGELWFRSVESKMGMALFIKSIDGDIRDAINTVNRK